MKIGAYLCKSTCVSSSKGYGRSHTCGNMFRDACSVNKVICCFILKILILENGNETELKVGTE